MTERKLGHSPFIYTSPSTTSFPSSHTHSSATASRSQNIAEQYTIYLHTQKKNTKRMDAMMTTTLGIGFDLLLFNSMKTMSQHSGYRLDLNWYRIVSTPILATSEFVFCSSFDFSKEIYLVERNFLPLRSQPLRRKNK